MSFFEYVPLAADRRLIEVAGRSPSKNPKNPPRTPPAADPEPIPSEPIPAPVSEPAPDSAAVNVIADDTEPEAEPMFPPLPAELPIMPLADEMVYPQTATQLTVAQASSIKMIDSIVPGDRLVGLMALRDVTSDDYGPKNLYTLGTMAAIPRFMRTPDGSVRLVAQGIARFRIVEYVSTEPFLRARIVAAPEIVVEGLELEALLRTITDQTTRMAELLPSLPDEVVNAALTLDNPLQMAYAIGSLVRMTMSEQQHFLELDTLNEKLRFLLVRLSKELEVLELGHKIQSEAQSEMEKMQREYYLREQMRAIQKELGERDEQALEMEELRTRIEAANMPMEALREARRELDRLEKMPTAATEYSVIRTYLDWMVSLPWAIASADNLNLINARKVLDTDHYGLDDVKDRIIEFLAVRKLRAERGGEDRPPGKDLIRHEREGAILCLVGPPGVGKTSLGASIARAMDRKFTRLSLGGIRDEADLRGFRRTYVGAAPGSIIQTMRRVGVRNPILMLDEIDKLGRDFRGDPASALLEVLDPEQNDSFRDHYLDVPFDLSRVLFITTANELDPIPGPLRDRMEIIQLSGYTEQEKIAIALRYLVPRQRREHLLRDKEITFTTKAVQTLIRDYTREAGVRGLEREIGRITRKVATQAAQGQTVKAKITTETVREMLKHPRFGYQEELLERTDRPGVAIGLSVTAFGGDVLFVEAAQMPGARGFQYTGQLGEVMQESARAALSYIRSQATQLGIDPQFFETHDLHLHVPAGAIPKDGPSAGVTMATALASLITGQPVRRNLAMTGEITLRGQVLPVGGIKDKVLAAHRFGVDTVIVPHRNAPDLEELPPEVRESLHFVLAERVEDVLAAALMPAGSVSADPVKDDHAVDAADHLDRARKPKSAKKQRAKKS